MRSTHDGRLANVHALFDLVQNSELLHAEFALCGGTALGLWLGRFNFGSLAQRLRAAADRALIATPDTAPPPGPGYIYHLPCALLTATPDSKGDVRDITPGVLYAGPQGLHFVPQQPSAYAAFEVGPVREVVASSVELPQRKRISSLTRPRYALHLRWPTGTATLHVPHLAEALPRVHAWLDELRYGRTIYH